ncbi:MAG: hypothetical protein N2376_10880 [Clostridia bacterium]|nr:hypothetical protein [Clostridia bacterium]
MGDFIVAVCIIAVFFIIDYSYRGQNNKKKLMTQIKASWGQEPENEYDQRDFKGFSQLFRFLNQSSSQLVVDDITWNDLELDRLYSKINSTHTSMGDETLYYLLRTPLFNKSVLNKRLKMIEFWDKHPEERERLQLLLARYGKSESGRVSTLTGDIDFMDLKNKWLHKVLSFLPILFLPTLLIDLGLGVFLVGISIGANVLYHEKTAKHIQAGIETIVQAASVVSFAGTLQDKGPSELQEHFDSLRDMYAKLSPLARKGSPARFIFPPQSDVPDYSIFIKSVFLIDLWSYQGAVEFVRVHREDFIKLILLIGELDASISIASYRRSLENWCLPEILWADKDNIHMVMAEEATHPLIRECTPNPVILTKPLLLTGSNASGKSTYLKSVALNTLLAHTIGTVHAKAWTSVPLFPITSMALKDSILNGESYFVAEIKSLKRIFQTANQAVKCLCVIDEVLRGTNTIERIAASSQLLLALSRLNACVLAATHDVELTHILKDVFENKHFEETITNDEIQFDYRIKEGRAVSRNAIKLLKLMAFEDTIVRGADEAVSAFEQTKIWETCGS